MTKQKVKFPRPGFEPGARAKEHSESNALSITPSALVRKFMTFTMCRAWALPMNWSLISGNLTGEKKMAADVD